MYALMSLVTPRHSSPARPSDSGSESRSPRQRRRTEPNCPKPASHAAEAPKPPARRTARTEQRWKWKRTRQWTRQRPRPRQRSRQRQRASVRRVLRRLCRVRPGQTQACQLHSRQPDTLNSAREQWRVSAGASGTVPVRPSVRPSVQPVSHSHIRVACRALCVCCCAWIDQNLCDCCQGIAPNCERGTGCMHACCQ